MRLLTGEWRESAGVQGKLRAIGYSLPTVSRVTGILPLRNQGTGADSEKAGNF